MKKYMAERVTVFILAFALSGCVVRTYQMTKDRVDQNISSGNRGYLAGKASPGQEAKERKQTRTIQAIEVELGPALKSGKAPKKQPTPPGAQEVSGAGQQSAAVSSSPAKAAKPVSQQEPAYKQYTVQEGDTLEKIAKKLYGSSKKWAKIYEANKAVLKGPDKIYPGQVINIPQDTSGKAAERAAGTLK